MLEDLDLDLGLNFHAIDGLPQSFMRVPQPGNLYFLEKKYIYEMYVFGCNKSDYPTEQECKDHLIKECKDTIINLYEATKYKKLDGGYLNPKNTEPLLVWRRKPHLQSNEDKISISTRFIIVTPEESENIINYVREELKK